MKHTISRNKVIWRFLMFGFTWVLQPFVSVKSMTHHDSPKVSRRCRRWCRLWHQSAAPHAPRHAPPPCGSDRHAWRNPWEIPGVKRQRLSCFAFGGIERDIRITYSHTHIICMYYVYINIYIVCVYTYIVYINIYIYNYIDTYIHMHYIYYIYMIIYVLYQLWTQEVSWPFYPILIIWTVLLGSNWSVPSDPQGSDRGVKHPTKTHLLGIKHNKHRPFDWSDARKSMSIIFFLREYPVLPL